MRVRYAYTPTTSPVRLRNAPRPRYLVLHTRTSLAQFGPWSVTRHHVQERCSVHAGQASARWSSPRCLGDSVVCSTASHATTRSHPSLVREDLAARFTRLLLGLGWSLGTAVVCQDKHPSGPRRLSGLLEKTALEGGHSAQPQQVVRLVSPAQLCSTVLPRTTTALA